MKYIIIYLIVFLIVYLFYLFTVILQKKRINKIKKSKQIMFFVKRYKIDIDKISISKFINIISLANSFIISTAFIATFLVDSMILGLLIGFLVLIPLMLVVYDIIGKTTKRKCDNND